MGRPLPIRARRRALDIHISTAEGQNQPEVISPRAIARGHGDRYLLRLGRALAALGQPSYLRLFGEMNNCHNAYAAYNCSGSRRNSDHSARRLKRAWRRVWLILHGGATTAVNGALRAQHMPPVRTTAASLPAAQGRVRLGAPDRRFASDRRPAPGGLLAPRPVGRLGRHVVLLAVPELHRPGVVLADVCGPPPPAVRVRRVGMWGSDNAGFASRLFSWIRNHQRVRMVQHNQGDNTHGPFRLYRYPGATRAIRHALKSSRFLGRLSTGG